MSNFEEALHKTSEFITFQHGQRQTYMEDLNNINMYIIQKMSANKVFQKLLKGIAFQGSYADNLKITKPDEYDIVFHLKLPLVELVEIISDPDKPGYVKINITQILNQMPQTTPPYDEIYKRLRKSIDSEGFLDQKKISSWFESLMSYVFSNSAKIELCIKKRIYFVNYNKCGPAHTLTVYPTYLKGEKISIDYVPSFIFSKNYWVARRRYTNSDFVTNWLAIPKPKKEANIDRTPNTSFISSFCDTERGIIKNKNQLKNVIRLLKKMRDKQNIQNLKSYHIKTVFLWEIESKEESFWDNSASFILMYMFQKLIEVVKRKELKFFWDSNQNMFGDLNQYQIFTMSGQLEACFTTLKKNMYEKPIPESVYEVFLTKKEIISMKCGKTLDQKNKVNESSNDGWCTLL